MAPFRSPDTKHDIALAQEVSAAKPVGSQDWEIIATRSGTEEDYGELSQLLEDISTYRRDCIEAKQIQKERKMKKEEADRKQAEHIRNSAMGNLGCTKKKKKFSSMSALEMLSDKYRKKTELKEKELNVRMSDLEFEKQKFNLELEERKQRHKMETEERQEMVELLKQKL
ncbi:Hypothetical predicted protein [Paramuricea clavata]|uniref:Uncharacterized protein n=1 Tax=Paramuricea clavata TaxID=317549 RepID=A0A6S7IUJ1_PARCT|nr:Hypothetical predicted protein [Paramuricea clavata]